MAAFHRCNFLGCSGPQVRDAPTRRLGRSTIVTATGKRGIRQSGSPSVLTWPPMNGGPGQLWPDFWPRASLLWPVCERGRLSAVMPPRQRPLHEWWSQRVFWYSDRPLPRAAQRGPREVRGAHVVIIDGPPGLPARQLVWLITYGPPLRYMGLYETRDPHNRRLVRRLRDMLLATLRMAGSQPRVTSY